MNGLNRAVDVILQWSADRPQERVRAAALLGEVIQDCEEAIQVWQDYLAKPGAPGDHWTLLSWIGPQRVRQLHEINLKTKARIAQLGALAGPAAGRFVDLAEDDVIEMAYRQLQPDETGPAAANTAVQAMRARIDAIRKSIERVRTARPVAKAAAPRPAAATKKQSGAKKPPVKKPLGNKQAAQPKPARKAAPKPKTKKKKRAR